MYGLSVHFTARHYLPLGEGRARSQRECLLTDEAYHGRFSSLAEEIFANGEVLGNHEIRILGCEHGGHEQVAFVVAVITLPLILQELEQLIYKVRKQHVATRHH